MTVVQAYDTKLIYNLITKNCLSILEVYVHENTPELLMKFNFTVIYDDNFFFPKLRNEVEVGSPLFLFGFQKTASGYRRNILFCPLRDQVFVPCSTFFFFFHAVVNKTFLRLL